MRDEKLTPTKMQRDDADALLEYEHGLNWSLPGTGKTMTSVCVIEQGKFRRVLVVCPKIAASMWVEVLQTQLGLKVAALRSSKDKLWNTDLSEYDAIVTTYTVAAAPKVREPLVAFLESGESIAILDEAHYCKSKDAKRAQALLSPPSKPVKVKGPDGVYHEGVPGVLGGMPGAATHASYVLQLTGTPITRYPDDLWMQLAYVRREVLDAYGVSSYGAFVRKFCIEKDMRVGNGGRRMRVVSGAKNEGELRELIEACAVVRRKLEDVAEYLPDISERWLKVNVALPKKVKNLRAPTIEEFLKKLNSHDSGYAEVWKDIGMAKVPEVAEYVRDQYAGQSVLIGFWHLDVGRALSKALGAPVVDGSTSSHRRDQLRDQFNSGEVPWLLGQIKAMGVSWNLQEKASSVVFAELAPSRGDIDQFIARVYRRGQQNHVQVDFISSDTGIDDGVTGVIKRKQKITDRIIK